MMPLGALARYAVYRKWGMRNAWRLSGMNELTRAVLNGLSYVLLAVAMLYLMSEHANATSERQASKVRSAVAEQREFTEDMRPLLAICLTRGEKSVWIGDELWIVGATPTGIIRTEEDK